MWIAQQLAALAIPTCFSLAEIHDEGFLTFLLTFSEHLLC